LQNQKAKKILDSKNLPDDIKLQLFSTAMKDATDNLLKLLSKPVRVDSFATKRPSNKIAKIHKINDEAETLPVLNLPEEIDEIIVSKLLKSIQDRGKVILHHLRTANDIVSWDQDGCIYFGNVKEPGSNIVNVIDYMTRTLKDLRPPIGINRVLSIARYTNLPASVLAPHLRKNFIGTFDAMPVKPSITDSAKNIDKFRDGIRKIDAKKRRHSASETLEEKEGVKTVKNRLPLYDLAADRSLHVRQHACKCLYVRGTCSAHVAIAERRCTAYAEGRSVNHMVIRLMQQWRPSSSLRRKKHATTAVSRFVSLVQFRRVGYFSTVL